ncbi:aspartate/glutamate racemase family protein [Nostoc sp. FACHB-152]|uniref:maleate cis-trans isomerase family protein n=1 Tax=unclassified Nostoc TaxID=2593658 RepID=UPI0016866041|nr:MULTISPECIES: aspartate/glutamate racemase family protein [unclassified Nostoc]MBD2451882.1 aspartate/glutamate racemase family protein [Nostoc sp. FACHB-152]MBD2472531.1 aspartate/glutamate racemase family protein [Nostoc sp. FACHB-145]
MESKPDPNKRFRLGLLVPAGNTTFEPDFHSAFTHQVSIHSHRVTAQGSHAYESYESMDDINKAAVQEVEKLAIAKVNFGAYGFTTATFYRGRVFAEQLQQRLSQVLGVPVVIPALALLEALAHLKAKKISVVTPYPEWNNQTLKEFLSETPFEIVSFKGDERPKEVAKQNYLWHQSPDEALAFIKQVSHKGADAIVLACTAWRTFEVIEELEADLNIPVVTANQATIWSLARRAAIESTLHPRGKLFNI